MMNLMEAFFLGWAFFIGSFCVTIVFFEYTCPNKYKMIKNWINECEVMKVKVKVKVKGNYLKIQAKMK